MARYVDTYKHGGKIGVIAMYSSEYEITLKTDEFLDLSHGITMHIAAMDPIVLRPTDLDPEIRNREIELYLRDTEDRLQVTSDDIEQLNFKINRQYCLLEQLYIRDNEKTIRQALVKLSEGLKDKVSLVKFVRWHAD